MSRSGANDPKRSETLRKIERTEQIRAYTGEEFGVTLKFISDTGADFQILCVWDLPGSTAPAVPAVTETRMYSVRNRSQNDFYFESDEELLVPGDYIFTVYLIGAYDQWYRSGTTLSDIGFMKSIYSKTFHVYDGTKGGGQAR